MEAEQFLRLVLALAFTLSLLGLCAWLFARYGRNLPALGRNNPNSRLGVIEWKPLDTRHQLLLVRRDNVEHLLLLSTNGSARVVERNIIPPGGNAP